MGDKYAPPQGLALRLFAARNRMKLLLPFCLLVVVVVWSSSTLLPLSGDPAAAIGDDSQQLRLFLRQCTTCGTGGQDQAARAEQHRRQHDRLPGHYEVVKPRPQLKETRDGRANETLAEREARSERAGKPFGHGAQAGGRSRSSRAPRRTLVKEESSPTTTTTTPSSPSTPATVTTSATMETEEFLANETPEMEEMDVLRTELSAALMQSEKSARWGDTRITGDLNTNGNRYALRILDEIRSNSLSFERSSTATSSSSPKEEDSSCQGKYVYVYNLPPEFNVDLAKRCDSLLPWFGLCDYFQNSGFGKNVASGTDDNLTDSQILQPTERWYNTHQYSLELVSHARMQNYKCRTEDQSKASLFYIPYYGGLDVIRWHWALNATNEKRDALGWKLVRWLEQQPSWARRGGVDHVLVLGKISWDFRRQVTGEWGSRLLEFPEMQKITKLLIERNPWHKNDIGVPHPTFFHPKSATDMRRWIAHITAQKRNHLVSFLGKDRHLDPNNVRSALISQCRNASDSVSGDAPSLHDCQFVECEQDKCLEPAFVTRVFLSSHFCMQPPGDSPTRRSVFDSLVAGCIPVLFHPCTAYLQYPWHLPRNTSSWSVYVSEDDVKAGTVDVVEVVKRVTPEERDAMRRVIVEDIVPRIVYAQPGASLAPFKDAFDVALENLLYRASHSVDLEHLAQSN